VEPPVARLLELDKVAPLEAKYMPSRNRRWHMYNCKEGAGKNPLRRTFLRGLVRHLNSPAVLAATYSGNAERVVSAAVDELEEALVSDCAWCWLHQSRWPSCSCMRHIESLVSQRQQTDLTCLAAQHSLPRRGCGPCVFACFTHVPLVCCCFLFLQTNCLEELTRPAPDHSGVTGRSDWVHLFHSVLPALPLHGVDEGRVASALRSACAALVAKHNTMFRAAGVAVWEMRFRVPGGAWRLLVSCPTGEQSPMQQSRYGACAQLYSTTTAHCWLQQGYAVSANMRVHCVCIELFLLLSACAPVPNCQAMRLVRSTLRCTASRSLLRAT
jgi:hypothetical protein